MTSLPSDREAVARTIRVQVRDCIGETIPLRRRWVSAIMERVIAPLLAQLVTLREQLAAAEARAQAAVQDNAIATEHLQDEVRMRAKTLCHLQSANAALSEGRARVAGMRKALEPFCFGDPTLERILYDGMPDDAPGTVTIKLGDIRRARAALTPEPPHDA